MAQRGAVDGWDPPSIVQVTVVPGPRRRAARAGGLRGPGIASLIALGASLGALVAGGASCAGLLAGGGIAMPRGGTARPSPVAPIGAVGEAVPSPAGAQAYRFPLGCLRITRTPETLAGAIRRRTDPCWRYGVYVTAILRRVAGTWRLALVASSRSCPRIALSAPVRAELGVCRR